MKRIVSTYIYYMHLRYICEIGQSPRRPAFAASGGLRHGESSQSLVRQQDISLLYDSRACVPCRTAV